MLEIKDLHVSIDGKEILKGINLEVHSGKVHAIMGPNGSGKSTLAAVLAGKPGYEITEGSITYEGMDLTTMSPEKRSHAGIFLAFQYPVEIPGVSTSTFLKTALNEKRKSEGKEALDEMEFRKLLEERAKIIDMDPSFFDRALNEGFSGGEKKRNEILQMAILEPKLAILDETDSGLDIDALKIVAEGINKLQTPDTATIIITHYQRILNYLDIDFVHVLVDGKIVKSGGKELAQELEKHGYENYTS